jgi:hypothetical protein
MSPLDVMIDNMRHFQQVAIDAESTLEGLTAEEFSESVPPGASPEEQFKFLLAQVKKTAGFRQLAQDAARDAAPYIHPKLSAIAHTGADGGPIEHAHKIKARDLTDDELARIASLGRK